MADIVNKVYTPAVQLCSQGTLPLVPRSERERGTSMKGTWEGWLVVYSRIWAACVSYFHYAYNKRDVSCTACQTPPPAPFTDTHLKRTPHYYRQFTLSLGRKALKSTSIPGSLSYSFSLARSVGTERREPLERGCPYIFSHIFSQAPR